MREIIEFRVPESYAHEFLEDHDGRCLGGSVRKVEFDTSDPRFEEIGVVDREFRSKGMAFFTAWILHRRYETSELKSAKAFHLKITHTFEPPGEECGTMYDESTACPHCGAGATQASDLRLDLRKAPKSKDIARTIAGEIIISQRLAEVLTDAGLKGFALQRVRHKARYEDDPVDLELVPIGREILQKSESAGIPRYSGAFDVWLNRPENRALWDIALKEFATLRRQTARARGKPAPVWYQPVPTSVIEILPPTRVGIDPFDDDPKEECRCPCGDTIGLNVLSELWVSQRAFENSNCDIAFTKQYVGVRRGLLRPERLLLISPRLWRVLEDAEVKGFRVDVAHLK